jgi:hypothetical protein
MYDLEDTWLNAISKLPDGEPLASLLRSATPMPPGVRDLLAELLNHGDPDICGGRLVYKPTGGIRKATDEWLPVAVEYHERVDQGASSETVAEDVAVKQNVSDRTVFRYVRAWKELVARLRGNDARAPDKN